MEKSLEEAFDTEYISLDKLVDMTRCFIDLAEELFLKGIITDGEYRELTYIKRNFIEEVEKHHII
jgi:hypothetical protein